MKLDRIIYTTALLFLVNSCQRPCSDDIVCETYIHRYGVPLPPQEWSERGQHGQIISTRKDGVVITKTYDAGELHGDVTYTFPFRETLARRCTYVNNFMTQEILYYPNGTPQQQTNFEGCESNVTAWYESGAPQRKEKYVQDLLVEGEYLDPQQQCESRVINFNGIRTLRDDEGQLLAIDEIVEGQMILRRTFHPNRMPAESIPFVDGFIEGTKYTYGSSGEPLTVEEWHNNLQHGNTEVFENGEKVADQPYHLGQIHGKERRYRDGCTIVQENLWKNGKLHGPSYYYVNDNKQIQWYFENQPVNRCTYQALCAQN